MKRGGDVGIVLLNLEKILDKLEIGERNETI